LHILGTHHTTIQRAQASAQAAEGCLASSPAVCQNGHDGSIFLQMGQNVSKRSRWSTPTAEGVLTHYSVAVNKARQAEDFFVLKRNEHIKEEMR
jgi:hypothetical protein